MTAVTSFFATSYSDSLFNILTTIANIVFIVGSGAVLYLILLWNLRRQRGGQYAPGKAVKCGAAVLSAGILIGMYGLYLWSVRAQSGQAGQSSMDHFCQLMLTILDPIFNVSNLPTTPVSNHNWTGPNFLFRALCAFLLNFLICKVVSYAGKSEKEFSSFLEKKIFVSPETGKGDGDIKESHQEPPHKDDLSGGKKPGGGQTLSRALLKLLPGAGILGSILTYVLGGDDTQRAIIDVIKAFVELMNTITLTSNISLNTPGAAAFFLNFLYIILSICILAVYAIIIVSMATFVIAAWKNKDHIFKWITKRGPAIFLCAGVTCLILLACAVVFLAGSSLDAFKEAFWNLFHSRAVFSAVSQLILLILSVCIVVLMLGFVIVFSFFVAYLGIQIGKKSRENLKESQNILSYAIILATVIIGIGALLSIGYGYRSISSGLSLLFPGETHSSMSLLWVVGHILLLLLLVSGVLVAATALVRAVITAHTWIWSQKPKQKLARVLEPVKTLLQIFVGYRTESEKNRAIFLAAAFASLASMLNTFFGLINFYNDRTNVIPVVCSLAISCAVQLAMLIFGMKAGEGFAERYMLGTKPAMRSVFWTLAFKVCTIIGCLSALILILCVGWECLPWTEGRRSALNIVLPIIFMLLLGTMLAFVIMRQCVEIPVLWREWREERKAGTYKKEQNGPLPKTQGSSNRKRLPPYVYLTAYLLLMLVSTGFAFNNLFGYYADQANLHEQVYDQVADQADKTLRINQRVTEIANQYDRNINDFISNLNDRASAATLKLEQDMRRLNSAVPNAEEGYRREWAQNRSDELAGNTRDFNDIVGALKDYVSRDVNSIGNNAEIVTHRYTHYWGPSVNPFYETTCLEIKIGENTDIIGQMINLEEKDEVKIITNGVELVYPLYNRYKDPDGEKQSIAHTSRSKSGANKYDIIKALLDLFDSQEQYILSYGAKPSEPDADAANRMRQLLNECDMLDKVSSNLKGICLENPDPAITVTIHDLPHLVANYTKYERTGTDKNDKLTAYQNMSNYIDRMLKVYSVLPFEGQNILEERETPENLAKESRPEEQAPTEERETPENLAKESQPEEQAPPEEGGTSENLAKESQPAVDTSAYTVREFRSYAQGITHSNFQISYDALFRGHLGLNPHRAEIDALYRSSVVATFILLICLLVDMMAFFGGLLLFKEIFLFEMNNRLKEIGYLNYEALLTNMFTLPQGRSIRLLHLALIYRLLYGGPNPEHEHQPQSKEAMKKTHNILNSKDFQVLYGETIKQLNWLGINDWNMSVLQHWLMDFVKKNEIDFDELSTNADVEKS